MRLVQILSCVIASLGWIAGVAAQSIALDVVYGTPAADGCFEAGKLQERVAHYLGARATQADELRFELYVESQTSAELRVFRAQELVSRRRFDQLPALCAERRDSIALSIALALEGERSQAPAGESVESGVVAPAVTRGTGGSASERQHASSAGAPRQPEAAAEPVEEAEASEEPEPDDTAEDSPTPLAEEAAVAGAASGWIIRPHVGARWLVEALPKPVLTGNLGVELSVGPRLAFDLSAFVSTIADSVFAGGSAQTWMAGGELLGCAGWKLGSFAAQGCAGAMAAACAASGEGYPSDRPSSTLLWAAGTARLAARWPDERTFSMRLIAQAHVNIVRPELHVDGASGSLAPRWVGAALGLDAILAFE